MDNMNKTDIEAFIRATDEAPLIALISTTLGGLVPDSNNNLNVRIYTSENATLVVMPSENEFLSVWLRGVTPWRSHVDFARFLSGALDCQVRCDPGSEHSEIPPYSDVFLDVHRGVEKLVTWG